MELVEELTIEYKTKADSKIDHSRTVLELFGAVGLLKYSTALSERKNFSSYSSLTPGSLLITDSPRAVIRPNRTLRSTARGAFQKRFREICAGHHSTCSLVEISTSASPVHGRQTFRSQFVHSLRRQCLFNEYRQGFIKLSAVEQLKRDAADVG